MNLSISNIGWDAALDEAVYALMNKYEYSGLEIAPTRIFPKEPYRDLDRAALWSKELKKNHGFTVSSMQSIWYGRKEMLFGSDWERELLFRHTKAAVCFAEAIGCRNLVFGCPRNRNCPEGANLHTAVDFFRQIGDYAAMHHTVIALEANPPVYNTNFINDTETALKLIRQVDSDGFRLNLDAGTMVENNELFSVLDGKAGLINHVHISEPGLGNIEKRQLHKDLAYFLKETGYTGFVSIEQGQTDNLELIEEKLQYIREIFTDK